MGHNNNILRFPDARQNQTNTPHLNPEAPTTPQSETKEEISSSRSSEAIFPDQPDYIPQHPQESPSKVRSYINRRAQAHKAKLETADTTVDNSILRKHQEYERAETNYAHTMPDIETKEAHKKQGFWKKLISSTFGKIKKLIPSRKKNGTHKPRKISSVPLHEQFLIKDKRKQKIGELEKKEKDEANFVKATLSTTTGNTKNIQIIQSH